MNAAAVVWAACIGFALACDAAIVYIAWEVTRWISN